MGPFSGWSTLLHHILWGPATLGLIFFTGLYFSIGTHFFQFRHMALWLRGTLLAVICDRETRGHHGPALSQFQTLSTALAGTIGTGSVVGVATAISSGGPGAIFWMWVCALLGMMTKFSENVLGNRYRYQEKTGAWMGGPMVYMERGLGCRKLAVWFAVCCALAAFGIGNLAQANSIAGALQASFHIPPETAAFLLAALTGMVLLGGIQRAASVAECFVPAMTLFFLAGGAFILFRFRCNLPAAFHAIFQNAFQPAAAAGGTGAYALAHTISVGVARGIFSNEAGLGSSVIINCTSNVKEPVRQGMWGIFEVFLSTMVICTMSALVFLCTGTWLEDDGPQMAIAAFSQGLGPWGGVFLSLSLICFAFSSIVGWSCYGERAVAYLFGPKPLKLYRLLFTLAAGIGCVAHLDAVWAVSDILNGFMALPNLIAILLLSKEVFRLTNEFLQRSRL
ncbi:MAG: sodium:alanine symporter family protein [Oscillospiraceae bacterium]|nr:sodium:alanine symporter family protein [Oscillospiraceae bacterium]